MHPSSTGGSGREAVSEPLRLHGDFHDCYICKLVVDFAGRRVELHLDDLFSGVESEVVRPGTLHFDEVEWAFCQIPFVGGEVRIEGIDLATSPLGVAVSFQLTTTEWADTPDFKVIRLEITARDVRVAES